MRKMYSKEEDDLIMEVVGQSLSNNGTVADACRDLEKVLDGRNHHAIENRYYTLRKAVPVKSNTDIEALQQVIDNYSRLLSENIKLKERVAELENDALQFAKVIAKARDIVMAEIPPVEKTRFVMEQNGNLERT